MKLRKIITMGLAAIMAVSAMSISAFADDNDIIYTIVGEDGNDIVYTQADIDAGHWNVDALGTSSPYIYEDFPISLSPSVDEFSNLSLVVSYKKVLSPNDSASISISDFIDETDVYHHSLGTDVLYTCDLEIDKYYIVTITETLNDETETYSRIIHTENQAAEMPAYITDGEYDSETPNICIADTDNLALSEIKNEDGSIHIDPTVTRYESIQASEFTSYINNLADNKIYRVFTINNSKKYYGFISTYSWGENIGIYMPGYTLHSVNEINEPSAHTTPTITSAIIRQNAEFMEKFGTYSFNTTSSKPYAIFSFNLDSLLPNDVDGDWYNVYINADRAITVEWWYRKKTSSTIYKAHTDTYNSGTADLQQILFDADFQALQSGEEAYFVIYPTSASKVRGCISIELCDYNDDITGSAAKLYKNNDAIITDGRTYGLYNLKDCFDSDCFYINNTYSSTNGYYRVKFTADSEYMMDLNVYSYNSNYGAVTLTPIDSYYFGGNEVVSFDIDPDKTYYKFFMDISISGYGNNEENTDNYSFWVKYNEWE